MKTQDIVILLKLVSYGRQPWTTRLLQQDTGISLSEINKALHRLYEAELVNNITYRPSIAAAKEFLIYGFKYCFPVTIGSIDRGIYTAHMAPVLRKYFALSKNDLMDSYVWPYADGNETGHSIKPLFRTVPLIAQSDSDLYEYCALLDALRIGRQREREFAKDLLIKKLSENA